MFKKLENRFLFHFEKRNILQYFIEKNFHVFFTFFKRLFKKNKTFSISKKLLLKIWKKKANFWRDFLQSKKKNRIVYSISKKFHTIYFSLIIQSINQRKRNQRKWKNFVFFFCKQLQSIWKTKKRNAKKREKSEYRNSMTVSEEVCFLWLFLSCLSLFKMLEPKFAATTTLIFFANRLVKNSKTW